MEKKDKLIYHGVNPSKIYKFIKRKKVKQLYTDQCSFIKFLSYGLLFFNT